MNDPLKICIQRAETREQWDAMQDDYINRALAAADRIEELEKQLAASNRRIADLEDEIESLEYEIFELGNHP